jgi:hypothetical protein
MLKKNNDSWCYFFHDSDFWNLPRGISLLSLFIIKK